MRIVLGNLDQTLQNLTIWIEQKTGQEIDLGLAEIQETLPIWIEQFSQEWQAKLLDIVKGLFLRGMGLINTLLNLLLLPVFTYYLLRDWDILLADAFELIPHKFRPVAARTFGEVNTRLNAFIIGQIKVCLALAVLYTVGLLIIGIDLAVPIGVVSGILFVIPYVGTVFGIFAASILALINFGVDWHVFGVFAVFGIAQTIEGYYLTPKIVGESVGLSPMVVMIALIVGASFMGIWGMLIAISVTAVLSVLATEWLTNYRESDTFLQHKD
jgi:predicted PurR-regulated permease PerM